GGGPSAGHPGAEGGAGKKVVTTAARRSAASFVADELKMSQRRVCGLIGISESSYRYRSVRKAIPELK
ncbi:MAG TPA: hypothetical protein VLJ83_09675, partial [Gemmatimonadaceae bacterium]|nr:hypothetical protein [Gemmatimonadaceae bacterium]